MQTLGDLFRTTRENKNIKITEASEATKIREALINALETGQYDRFTSETHVKSFIRAYARYLGINEEKALAIYRRDREIKTVTDTDKSSLKILLKTLIPLAEYFFNYKTIPRLAITIVVIIIMYFLYSILISANETPSILIIRPKNNEIIEQETFVIEGYTNNPQVKVFVDGMLAQYLDANGRFIVNAKFNQPGLKRFTIIAENQFQKRNEYTLDLIYRPKEQQKDKKTIRIKNNSPNEQKILVTIDDDKIFKEFKIKGNEWLELKYSFKVEFKDFNYRVLSMYLDDDTEPIQSIDTTEFSISMEGKRVILKIK